MTTHAIIRQRLLQRAGLADPVKPKFTLADLERSECSKKFETLMRNRLIMGALRYGPLHAPGKPPYDRTDSILKRLHRYKSTGNLELLVELVDIANLCLLEFE